MADLTTYGDCDPRFERVRGPFVENFQRHGEVGAAVSVMVDGHCAVDLWAGHADQAKTRAWERDTIVNVWSTTKGLCAMCAHRLADHGQLDFEAPVAKYWPEFAQAGKGMIPVSYLLNHKAGLAAIRAASRRGAVQLGESHDQTGTAGAVVGARYQARRTRFAKASVAP